MKLGAWRRGLLAVVAAAGLLFGGSAMTSLAGTMGVGAAQAAGGGPGAEQQSAAGETQPDTGQEEQTDSGQETQTTELAPLQINYDAFFSQSGWSSHMADNAVCAAGSGSWITAIKANLNNIPPDARVGVRYQVNISGYGWQDWRADGAEAGDSSSEAPLEALRLELTGSEASGYDLYYKVLQNGSWTSWAANGETAGTEGQGLRVDGLRASITRKDAGAPPEQADPSRPMIALTFDDGPRAEVTSRILDSLQVSGGRATFFMVGRNVAANAEVIRRMTAQGCEVANHTYDHKYLSQLGAEGIISQVSSVNQQVAAACGVSPALVRPPGGYIDARSLSVLGSMGMPAVMWSIDTRDWQHRDARRTIDAVLGQVRDGDIILMHDIYAPTADAAQVLIPELTARGYQLVTVSELAAARGGMLPGHKYSQFRP